MKNLKVQNLMSMEYVKKKKTPNDLIFVGFAELQSLEMKLIIFL